MDEFFTVGQLRKLLEGVPDERHIMCQVVATNGQAWNMIGQFAPKIGNNSSALLQMKHEELTELRWPSHNTGDQR